MKTKKLTEAQTASLTLLSQKECADFYDLMHVGANGSTDQVGRSAVAIMKSLPSGATIRDFINACHVDTLLTALQASALQAFAQPGQYKRFFADECHEVTHDADFGKAVQRWHDDLNK